MPSNTTALPPEAVHAMRLRLVRFILPDEGEVDARTVTILNRNRIFKTEKRVAFEDVDVGNIVANARQQTFAPLGPQLVQVGVDEDGKKSASILRITELLLDCRSGQRSLALDYVHELNAHSLLTPQSMKQIETLGDIAKGITAGDWQSAAVSLVDALEDDFLLNLAGLEQSLTLRFNDGIGVYLPRVLRPSLTSFESLNPPIWGPAESGHELANVIRECMAIDNLGQALGRYSQVCGYWPLGSSFSASAMVSAWKESHGAEADVWREVWHWGKAAGSPSAMYHVAEIGVTLHDSLEPNESELRQALREVLSGAISKEHQRDARWRIRCQLASHYCRHIEVCVPNQSGDRIPVFAWWIAEKVASLFGADEEVLEYWMRQFESTVETARFLWILGVRTGSESPLRYATLFSPSLWADSMLAVLRRSRSLLTKLDDSDLEFALGLRMLFAFPQPSERSETDFAFEEGLNRTVEMWQETHPESFKQERLGGAYQTYLKLADSTEVGESLEKFNEYDDTTQHVLANALRALAFLGTAPRDVMWEAISSGDWRGRVLHNCSLEVLDSLLQSARHLQFVGGSDWRTTTPHFFAQECIAAHDAPSRRRALLLMTIISSIAADAVSAVQRVAASEHRAELDEDFEFARIKLLAAHSVAPSWLAGRVRAVLSVL